MENLHEQLTIARRDVIRTKKQIKAIRALIAQPSSLIKFSNEGLIDQLSDKYIKLEEQVTTRKLIKKSIDLNSEVTSGRMGKLLDMMIALKPELKEELLEAAGED